MKDLLDNEEKLRAENKKWKAEKEAMEAQAKNLSKAYDDLADRFAELEKKTGLAGNSGKSD